MAKKQHYMTEAERYKLEAYREAGKGVSWIARTMGFCRQTIYNELRRGTYVHTCEWWDEVRYSADKGQQVHEYNQTAKGRPIKLGKDYAYARFLEGKCLGLQADGSIDRYKRYSPAAALAAARAEGFQTSICAATFYAYIHKGIFLYLTVKDLWEKPRKKRSYEKVQRAAHPALPGIQDRDEGAETRKEPGHWEMDLIIGKAKTKPCLLTLYERKKREYLAFKLPDKRASSVRAVFDRLERSMGRTAFQEKFKSITTDNGPEFLEYDRLVQSVYGGERFKVWYCHPYSAWEKGGVECYNRMARRWFPKGTDFNRATKKRIAEFQEWINGYPREVLGWKAPKAA